MINPWERQPKESYPAFEAFQIFLTERNYPSVARKLSKSLSLMKRWAKKNSWRERADAWDADVSRKAMDKASEEFASMIERQINEGRLLQARSANALQGMDFSNLPPKFIPALVSMLKAGVDIERTARELKIDKPQENLFVSTLEKISQRIVEDDD